VVYVDLTRPEEGVCEEEYVARMNREIRDALGKGMPAEYVENVLRPRVPERGVPDDGKVNDPFWKNDVGV